LCFWLLQMMRTTPARRTTLHFTQIFLTDDRTFIDADPSQAALPRRLAKPISYHDLRRTIRPRVVS
jgi:hypothetical protein